MDFANEIEKLEEKYSLNDSEKLPSDFPASVDIYHELSLQRTIIEIKAIDRIGLLFKLSQLINNKNFDITFARISTERGIVMDTFYLENINLNDPSTTSDLVDLRTEIESIIR